MSPPSRHSVRRPRASAARSPPAWARPAYRRMRPLWETLHDAFLQHALNRVPTSGWRDRLFLRGTHYRYYRRALVRGDRIVEPSSTSVPWAAGSLHRSVSRDQLASLSLTQFGGVFESLLVGGACGCPAGGRAHVLYPTAARFGQHRHPSTGWGGSPTPGPGTSSRRVGWRWYPPWWPCSRSTPSS
ncbi:DUF6545 domain-containing protein [Streptomyces sp. Inha503]|uniref:DUF6545 domain-containing protein n=1 Tax=Streptomyces sp. Inha503 TaxID=3383314 RepID=UPI0039A0F313